MKLKGFQVKTFRNIIDSGYVEIDKVTSLVGKNEAGKSAFLYALYLLNPAKDELSFNLLDEYPRWLKKEHELSGEIENATPIRADFELTDAELDELENDYCKGILKNRVVTISRTYDSTEPKITAEINYKVFVEHFLDNCVDTSIVKDLEKCATSTELIKLLNELAKEVNDEDESTDTAKFAMAAQEELEAILGENKNIRGAVESYIRNLIPTMFYFSSYSQLNGRYRLEEVLNAVTNSSDDEETQAAADFLKLARIDNENIETWDYEESKAELESISSLLTKRVKEHWKQNEHLKLKVSIETKPGQPNGSPERYLQFRVEDTRHDFTSRLDRRSTGFRWFVSFIAAFFEFAQNKNLILLLDEPGLSLHARAQMDLLDVIEGKLSGERQVVYTTHSPFMVRIESLSNARVVEDKGPEIGSIVQNEAGVVNDPDTLFPLQAALGYDIAQNLFIGNQNILLEGVSDLIYLKIFASHFSDDKQTLLPEESCRMLPCGGATNIATFVALLGGSLDVVILLDGNAHRQRIDNAITEKRLDKNKVISLDNFCSIKGADIEDLFEPDEYLKIYNKTFNKRIGIDKLPGNDRIVKRIERHIGSEFNHGKVAAYFLEHQDKILKTLSDKTYSRFGKLLRKLSSTLPKA